MSGFVRGYEMDGVTYNRDYGA